VNVQVNDDTGVDWASYVVTVATPISDPIGADVFLDNGGAALIDAPVAGVRALQIGGAMPGELQIEPSGTLAINEDFTQLANGALGVAITGSGLDDPVIQVAGEAHLAGTLTVEAAAGFTPMLGAEFEFLSALGGVNDRFDHEMILPALPAGMAWELSYHPTSVRLAIVESALPGDFNADGMVDAADYVLWRKNDGQQSAYDAWRANFGQMAGAGSSRRAAVPEPANTWLMILAAALTTCVPAPTRAGSSRRPDNYANGSNSTSRTIPECRARPRGRIPETRATSCP
jgi:hypothetical protein